ncbi:hypothetical protein ACVWWN_005914 [Mycobacterium sp. URHB0021]
MPASYGSVFDPLTGRFFDENYRAVAAHRRTAA